MRFSPFIGAILLAGACSEATDIGAGNEAPPNTRDFNVQDTSWPPGDYGSFHIELGSLNRRPVLSAVFLDSSPGFVNLASCLVNNNMPCLTLFPTTDDTYVEPDTNRRVERATSTTRFLGTEIDFAGYKLPYVEDDDGFGHYELKLDVGPGDAVPSGWVGASWGGEWPEFSDDQLLRVSDPIKLISPRPGRTVAFHDGQSLPIEWVPNGEGIVTLLVRGQDITRLYRLADDGYFELEADDLFPPGSGVDSAKMTLVLARWNRTEVQRFGHIVSLMAASKDRFGAEFFRVDGREKLRGSDTCGQAQLWPSLETGRYWGDLTWYTSNLPANMGCLSGTCAWGYDGYYRIDLPPKGWFQARYNVFDDSAVVYLVRNCRNPAGTCVRGVDADEDVNQPEFIDYFNPSDTIEPVYLVVDSRGGAGSACPQWPWELLAPTDSRYTLDVVIDQLEEPVMYDSCTTALDAPPMVLSAAPLGSGLSKRFYAEFTDYANDVNPGAGGCTSSSVIGAEAMTPIDVPGNSTLEVSLQMNGGDPAVYFMFECDNPAQCPAGFDLRSDSFETGIYENATSGTQRIYIVVDSKRPGLLPYLMNVSIN